ncbi:hypothetical protein LYNGBM3L_13370 [Moorena producens 3L]|uniref:Uncharacterized protein n=1 Tax=Moorena producens 3L TaxID=489825 RepID=F4XKY3_9CYAN|nr:hypothetical protein LYNGBM3L_13370 [Moorena producens 3L]
MDEEFMSSFSRWALSHPKRSALWIRLLACEITQMKRMLTSLIQKLIADS